MYVCTLDKVSYIQSFYFRSKRTYYIIALYTYIYYTTSTESKTLSIHAIMLYNAKFMSEKVKASPFFLVNNKKIYFYTVFENCDQLFVELQD